MPRAKPEQCQAARRAALLWAAEVLRHAATELEDRGRKWVRLRTVRAIADNIEAGPLFAPEAALKSKPGG